VGDEKGKPKKKKQTLSCHPKSKEVNKKTERIWINNKENAKAKAKKQTGQLPKQINRGFSLFGQLMRGVSCTATQ